MIIMLSMQRAFVMSSLALSVLAFRAQGQGTAAGAAPPTDAAIARAQQMVLAGQDSAGRALVDSVLAASVEGTPRYAEGLFWRATFSRTAAAAERDYRRISVEYPLSPRAPEALLRLAQLELTRGDRAGARAHLERLQREHPAGPSTTRGSIVLARLAFDDGDTAAGCAAVAAAREALTPADVEVRNQLDYYGPRCANLAARGASDTTVVPPDTSMASVPRSAADTTAIDSVGGARGVPASAATREFSVQVAAYDTRASAEALAKRLSARGYAARVVGERKPYRVRVGRYATRDLAEEVIRRLSRSNTRGVVVEAEPR